MPVGKDLVWLDRMKGMQRFSRESVGDVTLKRADGYWAYHLAVVVDDAFQSVTDIVRGEDLLSSTAAHLAIQQALSLPTINYAHHSVVRNNQGQKTKQANPGGASGGPVRFEKFGRGIQIPWIVQYRFGSSKCDAVSSD